MDIKTVLRELQEKTITPKEARMKLDKLKQNNKADSGKNMEVVETVKKTVSTDPSFERSDSIAIVGISGKYPRSNDMEEYWETLSHGVSGIRDIPTSRWNTKEYYDPIIGKEGKIYCKSLGMLDDIEYFDPLFFEIAPSEAENMDPQHRLFLQEGYKAFEDAGYSKKELNNKKCGVYLGIVDNEYSSLGDNCLSATGNSNAIGASRISYYLNLKGPAITVDTACSSSMVAVHLAAQALNCNEIDMALVGGACLYLTPESYISMCSTGMLSPEGQCKTFDNSADGFVPGEGVGALVLKRLSDAIKDHDHIYGCIIASGMNQDGKTNGITAPNMGSQQDLESSLYDENKINPESITYAEFHGTGTKLGDPIELEALASAFREKTNQNYYCAIGSVKSNLGHTSAAGGIAGIQKILLCMQHKTLVPTLNVKTPNEHFNFTNSPFYINKVTKSWKPAKDEPLRACISSFGFSGTNVHLVIEDYTGTKTVEADKDLDETENIFTLSAKNKEQLQIYVKKMLDFINSNRVDSKNFFYTLQTGREPMEERLAIVVKGMEDLKEKLSSYLEYACKGDLMLQNHLRKNEIRLKEASFLLDRKRQENTEGIFETSYNEDKLKLIAQKWVKGEIIDWTRLLYNNVQTYKISLPSYPFEKKAYWIKESNNKKDVLQLHPLVHQNISDFEIQCFQSDFSGNEFYVADHNVGGRYLLPGAAMIEMARVAGELSSKRRVSRLSDINWLAPVEVSKTGCTINIQLYPNENEAAFVITTKENKDLTYAEGKIVFETADLSTANETSLDISEIKQRCIDILTSETIYPAMAKGGINYGESFRAIDEIYYNENEALSHISVDESVIDKAYVLHPVFLDGAMQTVSALIRSDKAHGVYMPFIMGDIQIFSSLPDSGYAYTRESGKVNEAETLTKTFDVTITDEQGNIVATIKDLYLKQSAKKTESIEEMVFFKPNWEEKEQPEYNSAKVINENEALIVLANDIKISDSIKLLMEDSLRKNVICVKLGETYLKESEGIYQINPCSMDDYLSLLEEIRNHGLVLGKIVNSLLMKGLSQTTEDRLKFGFESMLILSKALIRHKDGSEVKLLYLINNEKMIIPEDCALSGMFRAVHTENPRFDFKTMGIDSTMLPENIADILLCEFTANDISAEVCYDNGKRYVKRFIEITNDGYQNKTQLLKDGGVYLITGGLGGVGLITADYLAQLHDVKIILAGRSKIDEAGIKKISNISRNDSEIEYIRADVTKKKDCVKLISSIKEKYGKINGIIHAAGMIKDSLILKKSVEETRNVLAAKVYGTKYLDEAAGEEPIDFIVLCSSLASALGNVGQCDYCYGNSFMDYFAVSRNKLTTRGIRYGKTISINWPLWADAGMIADSESQEWMKKKLGILPISGAEGMVAFEVALKADMPQLMVLKGNAAKIRSVLTLSGEENTNLKKNGEKGNITNQEKDAYREQTVKYLKDVISIKTKIQADKIDSGASFGDYGIDSIIILSITRMMDQTFGDLSKTLFFEYNNINELADYFLENHMDKLISIIDSKNNAHSDKEAESSGNVLEKADKLIQKSRFLKGLNQTAQAETSVSNLQEENDIAIIGISGKYPMADNIEEYWENLKNGRDCITEIPSDRWDYHEYFDGDKDKLGKTYSKWGGFINDVDKFDPLFFNIPPVEAEFMDPQVRLCLESAWQAMENAGYTRELLSKSRVGVYIGVMYGMYQLYEGELKGATIPASSSYSAIANRISYFFDFHGPSMAIDTMCSSSLTALHLACESLRTKESDMAFVGGVNLSIHPNKYMILSFGKFASSDGKCRSFGEGGDGYVPGEGVGTIIIKPLKDAIKDKDHIYAVIKGTAINAGGKSTGFTVPSPVAQSEVIGSVYNNAGIDVRSVSYIETHGTGTSLGDPIEINGMSKVFNVDSKEKQYCSIGSVKSNIGHLEGAAGIAGLTKVLLQMQHHQFVPSLHSSVINPYISFEKTPFYVQHELAEWKDTVYLKDKKEIRCPRRAGISSFGAGGSNAHVLLEEYNPKTVVQVEDTEEERLYLFSARNEERLKEYVKSFVKYLNAGENTCNEHALELKIIDIFAQVAGISTEEIDANCDIEEYGLNLAHLTELQDWLLQELEANIIISDMEKIRTIHELAGYIKKQLGHEYSQKAKTSCAHAIAYTLQTGREAMEERLAITACGIGELSEKLNAWLMGMKEVKGLVQSNILDFKEELVTIAKEATKEETVERMLSSRRYAKLADLWTVGVKINWNEMYGEDIPHKVSLPVYLFSKEHYWVKSPKASAENDLCSSKQLHPVLHENISDIYGLRFRTDWTGNERILVDHKMNEKKILPGVVYLEMVRAAVNTVAGELIDGETINIKNIAWISPAVVAENGLTLFTKLEVESRDEINFVVYSEAKEDKSKQNIHCQGMVMISKNAVTVKCNPESLMLEYINGEWKSERIYSYLRQGGMEYGISFQGIKCLYEDGNKVLALLSVDSKDIDGEFVLIPGIMDSALQAAIGFDFSNQLAKTDENDKHGPMLPFALENVEIIAPCTENMWALLQTADTTRSNPSIKKLNIDIFDLEGNVCIRVKGLTFREFDAKTKQEDYKISGVGNEQIMFQPVWSIKEIEHGRNNRSATIRKVLIFGSDVTRIADIKDYISNGEAEIIKLKDGNIAEKYITCSEKLLTATKNLSEDLHGNNALLQICLYAPKGELQTLKGLSGFLASMNLENPNISGQMIIVEDEVDSALLATYLDIECSQNEDRYIWYKNQKRYVHFLQEITETGKKFNDNIWKDKGVYLITGGAGGLGMIMANEVAKSMKKGTIILTGRSDLKPHSNTEIENLKKTGLNVEYVKADVSDEESALKLADCIIERYGQLNGIIHSAGIVKDNMIIRKSTKELSEVLSPKVRGIYNLDKATLKFKLDFIILMSSSAAVMGNIGQSDYSAANGFMDYFADYRNELTSLGERTGLTYSLNWPLWRDGGMQIDSHIEKFIKENTGLIPMEKETGIEMMYEGISKAMVHFMPMQGDIERIRNWVNPDVSENIVEIAEEQKGFEGYSQMNAEEMKGRLTNLLKEMLSSELELPVDKIDPRVQLEKYGMTSIMVMQLTRQLEKRFGSLSKTLLFEYQSIQELSGYLCESHAERVYENVGIKKTDSRKYENKACGIKSNIIKTIAEKELKKIQITNTSMITDDTGWDIAIIGLAGQYPKSADVNELWKNLSNEVDCITEIPKERWNHDKYYSPDKTRNDRTYAKWGGFIDGIEYFDPMFFHISPTEAVSMDPQERLFLKCVYHAVEDAGYAHRTMARDEKQDLTNNVGVFVGVMYEEYQLYGAQAQERGDMYTLNGSEASIANRISYICGFHGPSMAVDTMCSSSLTAIQLACRSIMNNECEMAVAGGVNLSLHPNKFLMLGQTRFMSSKGRCEAFGNGGDGYVPGEGVGAIILKPMKKAIADGDHIYGIVKGASLNHGGKTNGYTVPNPNAQTGVIKDAWERAGINPKAISYIEAHGTGTSLGDPIEISGLKRAFEGKTDEKQFCYIGSIKSNIGHCESAAGIAGITKILLQMKYGKIVPSLHSSVLNPNINFEDSPFIVPQKLIEWNRPQVLENGNTVTYPRIAGISAFGAGGSNAHVVIEEYIPAESKHGWENRNHIPLIVLSAKTEEQLMEQAKQLYSWTLNNLNSELTDIAYTLLIGRKAMEERLAFFAGSVDDVRTKLECLINGDFSGVYRGKAKNSNNVLGIFDSDKDMEELLTKWMKDGKYTKILDLWVKGLNIEWQNFFDGADYSRLSLPGYPFAKERYWAPDRDETGLSVSSYSSENRIHPVIHHNTSDFVEQRYSTVFNGDEPFLSGHVISGRKTLPAVVFIEMVYEALLDTMHIKNDSCLNVEFKDIVWIRPCIFEDKPLEVHVGLKPEQNGSITFRVYSGDNQGTKDEIVLYSTGTLNINENSENGSYDLEELKNLNCRESADAKAVYDCFDKLELKYGASQQGIEKISRGDHTLLAHLIMPENLKISMKEYTLYPAIMDSAIQACIGMSKDCSIFNQGGKTKEGEIAAASIPFMCRSLTVYRKCEFSMWAYLKSGNEEGKTDDLNIEICDDEGNVCVSISHIMFREIKGKHGINDVVVLKPYLKKLSESDDAKKNFHRKCVVLCNLNAENERQISKDHNWDNCLTIHEIHETAAQNFQAVALQLFKYIKHEISSKTSGNTLIQVVVPTNGDEYVLGGISGLIKTVHLEKPEIYCQLIGISQTDDATDVINVINSLEAHFEEPVIMYQGGNSYALAYNKLDNKSEKTEIKSVFKDGEVYLITGGMGGLGMIFAKEIAAKTKDTVIVLTGRSELEPDKEKLLNEINAQGVKCVYYSADVNSEESVNKLIQKIVTNFQTLHGVIHCAGVVKDNFIYKKEISEFETVLNPKVFGTWNLDEATKDMDLKFFALFSSFSAVTGNMGQSDYATANSFMDFFSAYRNQLVEKKFRSGKTISFNWPFWKDGGIQLDSHVLDSMSAHRGMNALTTDMGLSVFNSTFGMDASQIIVAQGNVKKIMGMFDKHEKKPDLVEYDQKKDIKERITDNNIDIVHSVKEYLTRIFSEVLRMPSQKILTDAPFEEYGIDSIFIMKLTECLEKDFGVLSKTLMFEYQTIDALTMYFAENHREKLLEMFSRKYEAISEQETVKKVIAKENDSAAPTTRFTDFKNVSYTKTQVLASKTDDDIAIIGISGRYAESDNLNELWENLLQNMDCITEIPIERWDYREYYNEDKNNLGTSYAKWGGFLKNVDCFDPLFFNVSPKDAEIMDPQERLFMEVAYEAIEDAGYTRNTLGYNPGSKVRRNVGVYVGVMNEEYQLYAAQEQLKGHPLVVSGNASSIANRLSYYFDFHGPSLAVDTMCSSSLVALHLACQAIRNNDCEMALVGGVNVIIHPNKYLTITQSKFASTNGRCMSFGKGGDGYVPGEGVGAILVKPKEKAIADGDHIYGIIKGSSINHGGKTNGYTVPNPLAQSEVIRTALNNSGINARTISYIEAHGTGTSLGDPIEISALSKVFREDSKDNGFCSIGSIKSNIGHCESASGIAAISKVLLQMKYGKLVPSLHSETLNPNIDFENSPFYVQHKLEDWKKPIVKIDGVTKEYPRVAGISAFGAGGTNAHIIIEEYIEPAKKALIVNEKETPVMISLSAKSEQSLMEIAENMKSFVMKNRSCRLRDLAYTLQNGREEMQERIAFVTNSYDDFIEKLKAIIENTASSTDIFRGQAYKAANVEDIFESKIKMQEMIKQWILHGKLDKLCELWVRGFKIDFSSLYIGEEICKVSLPTYPFENERYWIPMDKSIMINSDVGNISNINSHPLMHKNVSTFYEQCFSSQFNGSESFLTDHCIGDRKVLSGSTILEMVRYAGEYSFARRITSIRNVVWINQIGIGGKTEVKVRFVREGDNPRFEVTDVDKNVCAEGYIELEPDDETMAHHEVVNLEEIKDRCRNRLDGEKCYEYMDKIHLHNGPSFRVIDSIYSDESEAIAWLKLPQKAEIKNEYVLSPALLNGVFQSVLGLVLRDSGEDGSKVMLLPFGLEKLEIYDSFTSECAVHICRSTQSSSIIKFNISITDLMGNVLIKLNNFALRPFSITDKNLESRIREQYYTPCWKVSESVMTTKAFSGNAVLVFHRDEEIFRCIKEKILDKNTREKVYLIKPGENYKKLEDDIYQISYSDKDDYGRVFNDLAERNYVPGKIIFHSEGENLDDRLENGFYALFNLSKELMKCKFVGEIRLMFTFNNDIDEVIPEYSAVGGFARTIHMENPAFHYKIVEINKKMGCKKICGESDGDLLWKEFSYTDSEIEICYKDGIRMIREIEKVRMY